MEKGIAVQEALNDVNAAGAKSVADYLRTK
jgi:hypothetical protein